MSQQVRTRPKQDWQLSRDYHDREGAHTHNMVTAPEDPRRWSPRGSRVETELSSEEVFEGRFEKQQKLTGQSPEAKLKERGGYSVFSAKKTAWDCIWKQERLSGCKRAACN